MGSGNSEPVAMLLFGKTELKEAGFRSIASCRVPACVLVWDSSNGSAAGQQRYAGTVARDPMQYRG